MPCLNPMTYSALCMAKHTTCPWLMLEVLPDRGCYQSGGQVSSGHREAAGFMHSLYTPSSLRLYSQ